MIGWSLAAVSSLWGLIAWWVFRRFTDLAALRTARKKLYAHLLEIRLFSDEPAFVWAAQKALILDNARILALIWKPVLVLAIPFFFLYGQLDSLYGFGPLAVGQSTLVTIQMPGELIAGDEPYNLQTPPGIAIETPPIRVFGQRQISWRIHAEVPVRGNLLFTLTGAGAVTRRVAAGERNLTFYRRTEPLPGASFFHPAAWTEVDYPRADVAIVGLSLPWLAWFILISMFTAALFVLWGPSMRREPAHQSSNAV